jgi:hypothetical protein
MTEFFPPVTKFPFFASNVDLKHASIFFTKKNLDVPLEHHAYSASQPHKKVARECVKIEPLLQRIACCRDVRC